MTLPVAPATALLLALSLPFACTNAPDSGLAELQRVRSGGLDVVLLSEDESLREGMDAFTIEFRRVSGGALVDVGDVRGSATMPMPGRPSMLGSIFVERTGTPGRYRADTDLSMAGGWDLALDWDGPEGAGRASFAMTIAGSGR